MSQHDSPLSPTPRKIVSGGQTGVDRAALDVAIALGMEHGGWCPAGRLAEDGMIPSCYQLVETGSTDYAYRTEQNVLDSDATLILYEQKLRGGTLLTRKLCDRWQRPYCLARLDREPFERVRQWLAALAPETLNVAGPRESSSPGIRDRAWALLIRVLEPGIKSGQATGGQDRP